jgi:hypothetical protein
MRSHEPAQAFDRPPYRIVVELQGFGERLVVRRARLQP